MTGSVIPLADAERPVLARLLAANGLPTDDLDEPGRRFWRVADDRGTLGYGGLEIHGADALLRSVVVPAERRGAGGGRAVVAAVRAQALTLGVGRLWLLTTGAAGFFERFGFQRVERASAPPAIQSSAQFAGLCPGSAVCLRADLAQPAEDLVAGSVVTIYHNPNCETSRNTLGLIRNSGVEPTVIEYLKTPPSRDELVALIRRMGIPVRAVLRQTGTPYAELGLDDPALTDAALLDAMMAHPILINRPIVVTPLGVRLCRPSEAVLDLLPASQRGAFTKEDGEPVVDAAGRRVAPAS
ncbi:arsenate reductase (glutaredoxin) [Azospirillum sp. YIM DDC1]|uniref:Arsenate reductase n=1 Tax=Azospirillum aestuarii TaxID=2802052 RepID=A0ABS1I4N0_9PROT|nr:arsenate reductase (glutaredoxin) [Azospirillum aestuarii]